VRFNPIFGSERIESTNSSKQPSSLRTGRKTRTGPDQNVAFG
jgi:hypothetical protein